MPENKHLRFLVTLLYIALSVLLLWFIFKYALGWLAPFIIAFLFAKIVECPIDFFEKKLRFPRPIASILFTVVVYGVLGTAFYFATTSLIDFLMEIFDKLKTLDISSVTNSLNAALTNIISRLPLAAQDFIYTNAENWLSEIVSQLKGLIGPIVTSATSVAKSLPSVLIFVIAAIVSTYFFACDYKKLRAKIAASVSEKWRLRYRKTKNQVSTTLIAYIRALAILLAITFVELSIALSILGIKNSVLIAALIAVIDAMPILGTGWVLMPWAVISLIMGNYFLAIGLPLTYVIMLIIRNTIEPKIVGAHIGLHPLVTLLSMYIGLKLFGIIGMFMPIPVALIKQFYLWGYFDFLKKKKKEN